jgi:hypothetical protein
MVINDVDHACSAFEDIEDLPPALNLISDLPSFAHETF